MVVHLRLVRGSRGDGFGHERRGVRRRIHRHRREMRHRRLAGLRVVLHVVLHVLVRFGRRSFFFRRRRREQVLDFLVVNLHHRRGDRERRATRSPGIGVARREDLLDASRDEPARDVVSLPVAEHGVRLARARLAVREDAHLVPVQRAGHQVRDILENLLLARGRVEDAVEGEGDGFLLLPGLREG